MLVSWWASELAAGENQPLANLPAHWYLVAFLLHTILTEILRFVETLQRVSKSAEVGP